MKTKRIISLLLVISIIFSMTPSLSVNAAGQEPENTAATAEGAANITPEGETNPPNETGSNSDGSEIFAPRNMMLFSNSGADEVEYRRKSPEVAILNRYTGNSLKFYDTLTNPNSSYNGIGLFGKTVDSKLYAEGFSEDYSEDFGEDFLIYDDFKNEDNILNQLNSIKDEFGRDIDNLEAGVSGTFHNNWHTHTVSGGDAEDGFRDEEEFEVMSYSIIKLRKENTTIIKQSGKKKDYQTKPRIGNGEFASLRYHEDYPLMLQLSRSVTYYSPYREFCTCGGHHVEKVVVAFRDQRAPQISEVYMEEEKEGEKKYENIYKNTQHGEYREDMVFGEGKEINIKIKYDEPIRFADDSAAGKENLYVRLVVDGAVEGSGESIHPKAYLTELDEDTLYFSHTVPADSEVNYTISQIDLSPLIGTGIPLKQVGPVAQYEKKKILGVEIDVIKGWEDGSFAVEVPSDVQGKALGFTESSSYITDLAGNAINNELIIPTFPFYIDTQGVEVTEIVPNFSSRHYYEIKDMLGKINPYDVDYPDKSDTHIGTNSIFNFNITFSKTLAIGELGKSKYSESYTNLIATTNMKKDGEFISLKSKRADQRGPIKDLVTTISFENPPPLDSGVTCADGDGKLRITGISYFDDELPLKDKSGNEISLNSINSDLMTKTLYLDNKYAEVNTSLSEVGGIYTTEPMVGGDNRAFRFPFEVKDTGSTASGVNGLTGKFRWVKKTETSAVIAENWPFEYIITAKASLDGTEDWLKGYMGCKEYKFTQIEGANHYLYIRPVAGEEYSLFDTDLQFQALDYAGNKREWDDWISFPIDVVWEDQPPTASPGEVRRKLNESGDEGTIEVDVMLQDRSALKEAFYLWNNSQELPENPLWKDATINFTSGNKEGKITATETVTAAVYGSGSTEGESFSQNLWIKVSDEFDNELTANMGLYEYNLTQVGYELGCTSAITDKASIEVKKIDSGGSLVLMVKDPDTTDEYFVRVFDDTVAGQSEYYREAFNFGTNWLRMEVTEENGKYSFVYLSGGNKDYINRIAGGPSTDKPYFSGNLQVTVLSGRNEAFSFGTISGLDTKYPLQAGSDSHFVAKETVALRVSHNNEDKDTDTFPDISFSPIQEINTKPEWNADDYFWSEGDLPFLSTAEGVEFSVDLGVDKYGWNYEDINFANSYIELLYLGVNPYETISKAYLSSGAKQVVVFPYAEYKRGNYRVTLHLKCHMGKDYEIMLSDSMYIDPTPASTDFGVSSLTYTPSGSQFDKSYYSHGLDEEEYFNWEIDAYSNDQVIYLPAHKPEWPNILTVKINDYTDLGQHGVKIWNITTGGSAENAEFSSIESYDDLGTRSFYLTVCDTVGEAQNERGIITEGSKTKTKLGLVNNKENLIAVQVCNRNGLNSQIKYYTIHPVDEEVKGSTSISLGEDGSNVVGQGNVVFTPEPGQLMEGVRVFATAIDSKATELKGVPQEMVAQYDGTYTCPLTVGRNGYYIYSIDKYGNLNLYDITISGQQPTFAPPIGILDKEPPVVTYSDSSKGEGMYEAVFKIEDATINAYKFKQVGVREYVYIPLDISLYFDSAYTEVLGVQEGMSLDLRINENKDEYVWTTKGVNPMGIYEVRAERKGEAYEQYLEVTVKGAVPHKENGSSYSPTLYMDAKDNFGNSTVVNNSLRGSAEFTNVVSVQPRAYTFTENPAKSPEYNYVTGKYHGSGTANMGLIIEFNMPVLPESSWINPEPEYGTVQERAFPITTDGMQKIKYYDVFGNPFTRELDIGVLVDAGAEISVDIDPADLTAGDVTVSLKRDKYNPGGGILLFKKEGEELTLVSDDELTKSDVTDEKKITLGENATLIVYKLPKGYNYETYEEMINNEFGLINCHKTEIHISNIVKGAPEAKGYLYFTETGREYAIGDELPNQTSGNIQVRYTTSRKTSPTEGTDSIHTFKYGGNSSYTFYFEDQLGLKGNLKVDLNALGVTIVKPSQLIVDDEDPLITVNMYAKQFDRYSLATVFSSGVKEEDIKAAFDAMAYVQGYLFEVNVLDQSDYKIVLMKQEPPTGISYQVAASQTLEGVSLSGRTITVTEDLKEDIYVVVVDNAKAETGATKDNYSYILLKANDMTPYFDTIAPKAITETVSNSLYEKTVYISFSDKANADSEKETGLVTLTSHKLEKVTGQTGEAAKYNGWYKLIFNDSSTEYLVFYDMAGNRGTVEISVGEIDISKPELTVTWSPAYVSNNGEIDRTSPTSGPVNTDVKAIITADKPMKEVTPLGYTYDGEDWRNWPNPFLGQSPPSSIDYTSNSERITVTFKGKTGGSEQVIGVRMKVEAPNGKESEIVLLLSEGVIDKKPPTIVGVANYKYREDFTAPYAAEIVLTPDEPSYCLNAGKVDTLYDTDNPLKINTNKNETTKYRFSDKAGNMGDVDVTIENIDITPPKITTNPKDTKNFASSTAVTVKISVNEDCKIEYDGTDSPFNLAANTEKTLTFGKNGVYSIKASDLAGNIAVATVVIGNIDKTAPMISFDNMTIRAREGSGLSKLKEMLCEGVNVWDNLDKPEDLKVKYNIEGVNLDVPGLYTVPYTVTDTADNEGYANRYVRVFDKDMPGVIIGDVITEPDGTIVLFQGEHKLTIEGLKTIALGEMEPYTIKICNGIRSEGQMKYYSSTVPVDSEGNFTLSGKGFYTLYITTQSRQSYRTLLYVEK